MNLLRKANNRGMTLVEISVVLGLVGVVIAAIWAAASHAQSSSRANAAVEELNAIALNLGTEMAGHTFSATAGDITQASITMGAIPQNYVSSATSANSPWLAGGLKIFNVDTKNYVIIFSKPPVPVCIKLLLAGVNCQAGENLCPNKVIGESGGVSRTPDPTLGWQALNVKTVVEPWCTHAAGNDIEFQYAL